MNSNKIFSVSLGLLMASFLVLSLILYITRNSVASLHLEQFLLLLSLTTILLFLPNTIKDKSELFFLAIITSLPFIGIVGYELSIPIYYLIYPLALYSLFTALKWIKKNDFTYILLSFLVGLFVIGITYTSSAQILSPVFVELIINGKAVPDTLFHSTISDSINYEKTISTNIFGTVSFSYHWFSHYIIGGFSLLSKLKSIEFYNWAYPSIFIPLFIKYLFHLYYAALNFFKKDTNLDVILFPGLIIYISVIIGIGGFPSYLSSESLIIAHIFQFIFWLLVIKFNTSIIDNRIRFIILTFLLILMLFTKASIGLVTFSLAFYLFFRSVSTFKQMIPALIASVIIVTICLLYFSGIRKEPSHTTILERLYNFNSQVISYFSYSSTLIILVAYFIRKENTLKKIVSDIRLKKIIYYELIFISLLLSFGLGLLFASRKDDSLYFASTFYFLNIIAILLFVNLKINNNISTKRVSFISIIILLFSLFMTPQFAMIKYNSYNEKNASLEKNKHLISELAHNLLTLKYEEGTIIYIPPSENWYYNSQNNSISSPFIATSLSELPSLINLTEDQLNSNHYSFPFYKKVYKNCRNIEEAITQAKKLDYKKLIIYNSNNGYALLKTEIQLQ